jgi:signal transduction histidine kinase
VDLRWWVSPAIAAAVVVGYALGFEFAAIPILGVAVVILVYNALLSIAFSRLDRSAPRATNLERRCELVQVSLDYAAMFVLVLFTGGASSPLVWFFTFHVIFAAVLFRSGVAWVFALVATGGMWLVALGQATGVLRVGEVAFWGDTLFPLDQPAAVFVMLLAFTIAMFVTAVVTTVIVARLRRSNTAAYEAVEKLMHERSVYMLQVAHNIRAPLAASISMLDVIMEGYLGDLDERQTSYLDRIVVRLKGMNRTLGDLLQLALSRQRAEQASRAPVDIASVVAEVVATFGDRAEQEGIRLAFDVGDSGEVRSAYVVFGDRDALAAVFENLVSNAVKYTESGGTVRVAVSPAATDAVAIEIRDTGIGIPEEEQPRLFTAFFRASNARESSVPGSGLGLTLVLETINGHGGSISVSSVAGKGTTVTVELPLWRRPTPAGSRVWPLG